MDDVAFTAAVAAHENANLFAEIRVGDHTLRYQTPNTICLRRVQTLVTKEPDTIAWLNSLPRDAVVLDVGANVGMYSVYAAVVRGARVFAFEPEAQNYAVLCDNIVLNALQGSVIAFCAALSDVRRFDRLYLSRIGAGGSSHSFGAEVDPYLKASRADFAQGSIAVTVDEVVAAGAMPVPSHIKIDVDGFEHNVVKGSAQTLRDPAVRSLLIEINPELAEHRAIIAFLEGLGFSHDPEQFAGAQRKQGYFKGVGEYVFRR